jgi:hypothetical protein
MSIYTNMEPAHPHKPYRSQRCTPRGTRKTAHKSTRPNDPRRRERRDLLALADWRSSCLGYTRRYL